MLLRPRRIEHRSAELLREHYEIERELADRLRTASREQRKQLYREVYDELYRRVPHHPQLTRKASPERTRRKIAPQLRMLRPFLRPDSAVLEIGPGDCALSVALAERVRQVYGLDVSEEITHRTTLPPNFQLILSDGTSVPLPPESVDVAYSTHVMEHLHPEDALDQVRGIWRALRPGGVYVCITPNRLNGPHDVSQHFDSVATGFHMKEYTTTDLRQLFLDVGFRQVHALMGWQGAFLKLPTWPATLGETMLGLVPSRFRRSVGLTLPCRAFLGVRVVATK